MVMVNLEKYKRADFMSNEAYKTLRTNLQFCGSNIKMICFTSCVPNEGKSQVSFNLAISFAECGKRVLFIDADLRKSLTIGRYKPDQAVFGLTHYLAGQKFLDDVLYSTNIENFDIIFTGPVAPNPSELLAGDSFIELIQMLKEEYDYIILDTPPLGNVIDSAIVAEYCDGVVLVVEAKAVSYKLVQKVIKQLEAGNCRLLGAVLNKVDAKSREYKHYGKYYRKYASKYYYADYGSI